jgi:hypothetical protein
MDIEIVKAIALVVVCATFIFAMRKGWELTAICFGLTLLLASCEILGVR